MSKISPKLLPFVALFIIGIVWATTVPLIKIAVSDGLQPFGITFWEVAVVASILLCVILIRGYHVSLKREHLKYCFVLSLTGTLFPNAFSYIAVAQLPAGIFAIVIATVPMCVLVIALLLRTEPIAAKRIFGILLGVAAMVLLAVPESSLPEPEKAIYILVAFVAPLSYGIEGNYISLKAPKDLHPVSVLFVASLFALPISGIICVLSGQFFVPNIINGNAFSNAELAILAFASAHAFAYAGYMWLVGLAGPVFTSQIAYIVTVTAVTLSWYFLGEEYSNFVWVALIMMLGGLALVKPSAPSDKSQASAEN